KEIIPHRQPFLLIDRVVEYDEGQRCVAIKQVSCNEPFFQAHFPEYAVMPGVLITEALAQTGAVAMLNSEANKGKLALCAGIDTCRFNGLVSTVDTLNLVVEIKALSVSIAIGSPNAIVDGDLACSCGLAFALNDI